MFFSFELTLSILSLVKQILNISNLYLTTYKFLIDG